MKSDDVIRLAGDVLLVAGGTSTAVTRSGSVAILGLGAASLGWLVSTIGVILDDTRK